MLENGPRKFVSAMERAVSLETKADELGVSVASLLPPADVWKPNRRTRPESAINTESPALEPSSIQPFENVSEIESNTTTTQESY